MLDAWFSRNGYKVEYHYPNKVFLMSGVPHTKETLDMSCIDGFIEKPFYLKDVFDTIDAAVKS